MTDWRDDPTVVLPREASIELMLADPHGHMPLARVDLAPIPARPADPTDTSEIAIPPELLTLTL